MGSYLGRHADYYDTFYSGKDYAAESAFVHRALGALGSVERILELACGTGAHALHLERFGYEILATDYSADMLRVARRKAEQVGSRVQFLAQDMRNLDPKLTGFDAVIALFDSIGYVRDNDSVAAVLAGVRRALKPGGLFLFEFWHAAAMLRGFDPVRVKRWETPTGELIRISETSLSPHDQLATVQYEIIDMRQDGTFERLKEVQVNRFFSVPEMQTMLRASGLTPRKFYAGFTDSERIDESIWHVIAVAQTP